MNDPDNYYKSLIEESPSRRPNRLPTDPVDRAATVIGEPLSPPDVERIER